MIMGVAPTGSQLSFDPMVLLPGRTLKSSIMGGRPFRFLSLPRILCMLLGGDSGGKWEEVEDSVSENGRVGCTLCTV